MEDDEVLVPFLKEIQTAGIKHIILLSGLSLKDTATILESHPEIDMAISGGDYTGRFYAGKASRVDLSDGRSILILDGSADYYLLEVSVDKKLKVRSMEPRKAVPIPTRNYAYDEFKERLALWKEKFVQDENRLVAGIGDKEYGLDDYHFTQLLRDRFNCELGIVEENTLNPMPVNRDIKQSDFLSLVNRDYNIFIFSLTGDELRQVLQDKEGLLITGMDGNKDNYVQGYPLVGARPYRVAASQPALQRIRRIVGKHIDYRNTWMTVTDLLMDDLKTKRIVLRKNYDYLDRRFRTTVDAYLANFVDSSSVSRGSEIDTPPGQPAQSYTKWGLENKIDLTIYNKYHRFIITPYMLYSRQDDSYLNNILRGTFLYDYNLSETYKPYNKFVCETVVEDVDGQRPVLLRETLGVSATYKIINGKIGIGFEKEVQDPSNAPLYGIEFILGARVPFLSYFTYSFDLDTFTGIRSQDGGQRQLRSEINNAISAKISSHMSLSFRHKFFYVYEDQTGDTYRNSQFITSLDLNNDWKFW